MSGPVDHPACRRVALRTAICGLRTAGLRAGMGEPVPSVGEAVPGQGPRTTVSGALSERPRFCEWTPIDYYAPRTSE